MKQFILALLEAISTVVFIVSLFMVPFFEEWKEGLSWTAFSSFIILVTVIAIEMWTEDKKK